MIGDPFYIVELDQKLRKNREEAEAAREYNNDPTRYRARIASVAALEKQKELERKIKERDVVRMLELGCDYREIQSITRMPMSEISRIEKEEKERRRFLATGQMSSRGGHFAIYNGLPTRR